VTVLNRILYLEVDESDVSLFRIPENDIEGTTEDHRYPLAGSAFQYILNNVT
jgi:hypothetical protein